MCQLNRHWRYSNFAKYIQLSQLDIVWMLNANLGSGLWGWLPLSIWTCTGSCWRRKSESESSADTHHPREFEFPYLIYLRASNEILCPVSLERSDISLVYFKRLLISSHSRLALVWRRQKSGYPYPVGRGRNLPHRKIAGKGLERQFWILSSLFVSFLCFRIQTICSDHIMTACSVSKAYQIFSA